jgi:chromosome segregation ATPase
VLVTGIPLVMEVEMEMRCIMDAHSQPAHAQHRAAQNLAELGHTLEHAFQLASHQAEATAVQVAANCKAQTATFEPQMAQALAECETKFKAYEAQMQQDIREAHQGMRGVEQRITRLEQDYSLLKQKVAVMKLDVVGLKQDITELRGRVDDPKVEAATLSLPSGTSCLAFKCAKLTPPSCSLQWHL